MADDLQDFIPFEETSIQITMMNSFRAPWLHSFSLSSPAAPQTSTGSRFIALHNEILAFCDFISPTAGEIAQRKALVSEIESIVHEVFPTASVHIFGSQLTTILTPTSDLDLAILDVPCGENGDFD
jgi:DNA polymerase sigma